VTPLAQSRTSGGSKRARAILEAALKRKQSERVAFIDGACADDDGLRVEVVALLDGSESRPGPYDAQDRAAVIVHAAVERRRTEVAAFIEGACGGDEALKARVLAMLAAADGSPSPAIRIIKPVAEPVVAEPISSETDEDEEPTRIAPRPEPAPPSAVQATPQPASVWRSGQPMEGRRIGPYQLLHTLGKGGMGSVYAASRADQEYKKIVAIKLVTYGLGSEEMLRRFRNERQVLAGLDHPYIARLLDGGTTDDGLPYLVMEFVEGLPIDRYCEANQLSTADRLKLFQKVCSAVQFAHQNLVVHRDIKPGNILVGASGEPKLLDFGIAKIMTAEFSAEEAELNRGESPMTLRYASPEQVRGEPITTASDIYSLGVLLYELLAGEHPFHSALTGRAAIERAILTTEPDKPSATAQRLLQAQPAANAKKPKPAGQLSADTDTIVLTAMQKQPRARYPSAESFAWDITRYLNGFPVYARRDDMGYRTRKFIQRHVVAVVTAALVVIALIVSTLVSLRNANIAVVKGAEAQSRFNDVRKLAHFVLFNFDEKASSGGLTVARQAIVAEALDYLNRLAKDSGGDPELESESIEGYLKVGDLQGNPYYANVGGSGAARESYLKAMQAAETLRAKHPEDARARLGVARANVKLGDLSANGGDQTETLKRYRQAQELFESLASNNLQAKRALLQVTERIGTIELNLGEIGGALKSYARYLRIAQELVQSAPNDPAARNGLALAFEKNGQALVAANSVAEGLAKLRQARAIYQEMAGPQSPIRRDVAMEDILIADALAQHGQTEEAAKSYRSALQILDVLVQEDQKNTQFKRDRYDTLIRLANMLGKRPEAHEPTAQALKVLQPMVEAGGERRELFSYALLLMTTPFHDLQRFTLARRYAEQLVKTPGGNASEDLDLLAMAYDLTGDSQRAVKTEIEALKLLPPNSVQKADMDKSLAAYRAHAEHKQPH
jgi:serine/threonine protein kinase/tetratricopeptide (TPR) repeat protein